MAAWNPFGSVTNTDTTWGFGNYSYISPSNAANYYQAILDNQQAIWDREDSAYQRAVADMKKAGINPWTASGTSGSPTSSNNGTSEALNGIMQLLSLNNSAIHLKDSTEQWCINTVLDTLVSGFKMLV